MSIAPPLHPLLPERAPDPAKVARLHQIVDDLGSVLVAFSGGVDSALVLQVARVRLGRRACAAIGVSPSLPPGELESARRVAREVGAELIEVATRELEDPRYAANPPDRCYFCKRELYGVLAPVARRRGLRHLADGLHLDDLADVRPGRAAADEAQVSHPLAEAGLCKAEVRALARALGLSVWQKPALACLSSRVPHGSGIDAALLGRIGTAELALHGLGFAGCRVRVHGDVARVELRPEDLARALERRAPLVRALKEQGFRHVALDLEGYRSGSMNAPREERARP